jgi:hypothetical protein
LRTIETIKRINKKGKKDMITLKEKRTFKKTEVHDILFSIFEHYGDLVLNGMHVSTESTGLWYTDFNNKFGFYDRETGVEIGITIDLNNIHQINDMFIEDSEV